jgi:hypothetical protein
VVAVEALVAKRLLSLSVGSSLKLALKANLWSTAVGVPLVCIVMLFVGGFVGGELYRVDRLRWLGSLFFGSAIWIEDLPNWVIYAGPAVLTVPCYLVSVRIEAWSAAKTVSLADAKRWSRTANAISYGVLLAALTTAALRTPARYRAPNEASNSTGVRPAG